LSLRLNTLQKIPSINYVAPDTSQLGSEPGLADPDPTKRYVIPKGVSEPALSSEGE
jgi:hypothetical protein